MGSEGFWPWSSYKGWVEVTEQDRMRDLLGKKVKSAAFVHQVHKFVSLLYNFLIFSWVVAFGRGEIGSKLVKLLQVGNL